LRIDPACEIRLDGAALMDKDSTNLKMWAVPTLEKK